MLKKISIILAFFVFFVFVFSISYSCSAAGFINAADSFIKNGEGSSPIGNMEILSDTLYNILFTIGVVVAAIFGIIIGIQFVTGSVEQKAKVKETLIPYFVGCFVIFGAFGIWKLVITILRVI